MFFMNRFFSRYEELGQEYNERYISVRPRKSLRVNTLKITEEELVKRLTDKGVVLEKIPFLKNGYYYKSKFSLGSTPEYLQGFYYLQEAASQIPAMCLDLEEGDIVLDMAAAPGSKTTQIAQLMNNTGVIVATDINRKRLDSVKNNAERCGVKNIVGHNINATEVEELNSNFDKILLDAPCSGNYANDQNWFSKRKIDGFIRNSVVQKELIMSAEAVLKKGGILVYSTCSLEPEENELTVNWALQNLPLELQDINIEIGCEGLTKVFDKELDQSVSKCKRLWPWDTKTQGFFISKFKKI